MKILLLMIALCVLPIDGISQWTVLGKRNGSITYVQRQERDGDLLTAWLKRDGVISHVAFDCQQSAIRQLVVIKQGRIYGAWNEFHVIGPKTYGEWVFNRICP